MKLKVCGLKYKENIEQIAQLNVDYMGFIFYPKSKRYVGEDFEMPVVKNKIKKTGVFVNAELNTILEKVKKYGLSAVQLHGDEAAVFCKSVKEYFFKNEQTKKVEIIKAFGVDEAFDFEQLKPYEQFCDYFLFDTKTKEYGGSGHSFNWEILQKYNHALPFFLSGGIGLKEVEQIKNEPIARKIYAIDVNSKFEIEPGLKDVEMIKKLIDNR
jgi:phosphoribosylanthranilate isomerase